MGKSKQKTVKIIKEPCDRHHYYTAINLNAIDYASSALSGDGLKMWLYFAKNQNDWSMSLSSKHAEETFNISKRRYDNGIHELIECGFLVDVNTDPSAIENLWEFHELPSSASRNDGGEEGLVNNEYKPLQQNNISLNTQENKAYISDDTRNNTNTINNTTETLIEGANEREQPHYKNKMEVNHNVFNF